LVCTKKSNKQFLYLCAPNFIWFVLSPLKREKMQTITVQRPEETQQLAAALGKILTPGDVVILNGPLAAGKTFFVQALARALGSEDYISSPTYTIANFYNVRSGSFLHMDVYRLENIEEFRDLALDEYFEEAITLIEWGQKVADDFEEYLLVDIAFVGQEATQRAFTFTPVGTDWQQRLSQLKVA
jgi:tRNA threonylcarbamoyladenosine biosynthesis protein TsaE